MYTYIYINDVASMPVFNFVNHRSHGVDPKKYEENLDD